MYSIIMCKIKTLSLIGWTLHHNLYNKILSLFVHNTTIPGKYLIQLRVNKYKVKCKISHLYQSVFYREFDFKLWPFSIWACRSTRHVSAVSCIKAKCSWFFKELFGGGGGCYNTIWSISLLKKCYQIHQNFVIMSCKSKNILL